jgi:hypothetical protein
VQRQKISHVAAAASNNLSRRRAPLQNATLVFTLRRVHARPGVYVVCSLNFVRLIIYENCLNNENFAARAR